MEFFLKNKPFTFSKREKFMNTLLAFVLVGSVASVNPYENIDVSKMNSVEKEFVVDQEAKIKNSVPKIHDEIQ